MDPPEGAQAQDWIQWCQDTQHGAVGMAEPKQAGQETLGLSPSSGPADMVPFRIAMLKEKGKDWFRSDWQGLRKACKLEPWLSLTVAEF